MSAGFGLVGGALGTGLQNFTESYLKAKQMRSEQDTAKAQRGLMNMKMQEEGYSQDPNSGAVTPGDLANQRQQLAQTQMQSQIGEYDPNNVRSKAYNSFAQNLVSKAAPGVQLPAGMSAHDLNSENGLINTAVKSGFGMQGQAMRAQAMGANRDLRSDAAASKAGGTFENDPLIRGGKQVQNSLTRGWSLLHGQAAVTAPIYKTAMQDLINAVAQGGAATEGKVNRELPDTLQVKVNELESKFGDVPDLRNSPGAQPLLQQIDQIFNQIYDDYDRAISNQTNALAGNFVAVSNPKVQTTVENKVKTLTNRPRGLVTGKTNDNSNQPGGLMPPEVKDVGGSKYQKVNGGWQRVQ